MEVMDIFEDYNSFRTENFELISGLVKRKSKTIQRFAPAFIVTNYLYEEHLRRKLTEDEEVYFSSGFDYIFDQFQTINTLYENVYDNNLDEMEKVSQTINLLLYINEFQGEVLDHAELTKDDIKPLDDLEDKVLKFLDNHENAPDEYFVMLNEIVDRIFEGNNIEVMTIDEIFYEIAVEYDLYEDDDFNLFNKVLTDLVMKSRKK